MTTLTLKLAGMTRGLTEKEYGDLIDFSHNGVEIRASDKMEADGERVPMPWDASFRLSDDKANTFILSGGMGPSGFGSCECSLPLSEVDEYYDFEIWVREGKLDAVMEILSAVGIEEILPTQRPYKPGDPMEEGSTKPELQQAYWSVPENDWVQSYDDATTFACITRAVNALDDQVPPTLNPYEEFVGITRDSSGKWIIVRASILV